MRTTSPTALLGLLFLSLPAFAGVEFTASFGPETRAEPATGRLLVFLIGQGSSLSSRATPADAPFFSDPQPMYGIDVTALPPGGMAHVGDAATAFPVKASELPAGTYVAQAVLDMHRADSQWSREAGNLFTAEPVRFTIPEGADGHVRVQLPLDRVVPERELPEAPGLRFVETPSALLSAFHGRPVTLRAGVVFPTDHDPARRYPAVYSVPGFGGNHHGAIREASMRRRLDPGSDRAALAKSAFVIHLDPESANGHTLFADSANNGPVGRALVEELIPYLEEEFGLIPEASARIVTGHSSGGWSSLWLGLTYPETFGAVFSSAPDPVDFRAFQKVNIYEDANAYVTPAGTEVSSYRSADGQTRMTMREENLMEEVLGPGNTSGQQWDSWFAVFGPRDERGNPAALWHARTGEIDHRVAEAYRTHDIGHLVRTDPERYVPIFERSVRLIVGSEDTYHLERAVGLLRETLRELGGTDEGPGYIEVLEGFDHGSIFRSERARGWTGEMVEVLVRAGHAGR